MINALVKAINNKLQTTAGVTSLLAAQPGGMSAIYYKQAPTTAVLPYIVYVLAGGGDDNMVQADGADVTFYIQGISTSPSGAASISTAIRAALHAQPMTIDAPWSVYRVQHKEIISYVENVDAKVFHHEGGSYRIRLSQ